MNPRGQSIEPCKLSGSRKGVIDFSSKTVVGLRSAALMSRNLLVDVELCDARESCSRICHPETNILTQVSESDIVAVCKSVGFGGKRPESKEGNAYEDARSRWILDSTCKPFQCSMRTLPGPNATTYSSSKG